MIYAVFEDGSRQYRVDEGDLVRVDYREANAGDQVEFDRVLVFQTGERAVVGQPTVAGAKVRAEVVDHPTTKTYIQKFRRRKNYKRLRGHRQEFTRVRILELVLPGWQRPADEEVDERTGAEGSHGDGDAADSGETAE